MASNCLTGNTILCITVCVFLYYFMWTSVLPFILIDEDNWIRSLFPPQQYAFLFPVAFGVVFLGGLSAFTVYHVRCANRDLFKTT